MLRHLRTTGRPYREILQALIAAFADLWIGPRQRLADRLCDLRIRGSEVAVDPGFRRYLRHRGLHHSASCRSNGSQDPAPQTGCRASQSQAMAFPAIHQRRVIQARFNSFAPPSQSSVGRKPIGWTWQSSWRMVRAFVFNSSYPTAQFSTLYLFGRGQDIGFQKAIDNSPTKAPSYTVLGAEPRACRGQHGVGQFLAEH